MVTWEELEMSAYQAFRMSEAEHVAKNYSAPEENDYPAWVYESANVDYEMHLYDQYKLTFNGNGHGAYCDGYGWWY